MKPPNKPAMTAAERRHVSSIKAMDCVVCGESAPSEAHEPEQGFWWVSIPLCPACHRGPDGWHGSRQRWKLRKMTELGAINKTLGEMLNG